MVAVFHDLTNRHLLYQMRREFVANISHELRTPLTAIMGVAEIMRDQSPADDEFRPWLDALDRQARRLNTLAREILELARLEDIKAQPLRRESIPVKNLLAAMSERIPPEARSQLSLDSDVDDLEFSGDWDSLLGALANLVDNAVKYGEPGGRITLQARRYGDLVELAVINQGAPVDPEDRERIFERFYRSEKSRREGLGGVGLGLAIVKHVARVHGGRAYLKCPSGGGSVFTMSLPIKG